MAHKRSVMAQGRTLLASNRCFWLIVGLLLVEASWLALSGRYPMAFDEDYHLGIIRLYAHHLSPFWSAQPAGANALGAVARDPSYLYHWLMSFPYRLITLFTKDQTIIVLLLRAINIALFSTALPLFRRLLLRTGASRTIVHFCLLLFVLIPVVPLLAAQINYDNLLIPMVGLIMLCASQLHDRLQTTRKLDVGLLLTLVALCLAAAIIKYAALPIFVAIAIFVIWDLRVTATSWRMVGQHVRQGFRQLAVAQKWLLVLALLLLAGLNIERYGVNLIRYHNPVPDCSKVLTVQQCSAYGPWIRDYNFSINKVDEEKNPVIYMGDWLKGMWIRLFFAVDGPATQFQTRGPLAVPGFGSLILIAFGVVALVTRVPRVLKRYHAPTLWLMAGVMAFYVAALWLDNYRAWVRTGQPVAINGRYLLPIMLPLLLLTVLSAKELLSGRRRVQGLLAAGAVLTLLWGGGALTYILRSEDTWYWPAQPVYDVNHALKRVLGPVTPGYADKIQFLD